MRVVVVQIVVMGSIRIMRMGIVRIRLRINVHLIQSKIIGLGIGVLPREMITRSSDIDHGDVRGTHRNERWCGRKSRTEWSR